MGVAQRLSQLRKYSINILHWEWTPSLHLISERPRLQIAHHEISHAIGFPIIEDRQDMGMLQLGNDARFLMKAGCEFLAFGKLTRQHFNRDITIHRGLVGFINISHAALTNLSDDSIGTEHLPGLKIIHFLLQIVWRDSFDELILRLIGLKFKLHYPGKVRSS